MPPYTYDPRFEPYGGYRRSWWGYPYYGPSYGMPGGAVAPPVGTVSYPTFLPVSLRAQNTPAPGAGSPFVPGMPGMTGDGSPYLPLITRGDELASGQGPLGEPGGVPLSMYGPSYGMPGGPVAPPAGTVSYPTYLPVPVRTQNTPAPVRTPGAQPSPMTGPYDTYNPPARVPTAPPTTPTTPTATTGKKGGGAQAKVPSSPAPPGINQQWWDEFTKQHGGQDVVEFYGETEGVGATEAVRRALSDREWSEQFAREAGRPPNQDEWESHYYATRYGGEPLPPRGTPEWEMWREMRRREREKAKEDWLGEHPSATRPPLWIPPDTTWYL